MKFYIRALPAANVPQGTRCKLRSEVDGWLITQPRHAASIAAMSIFFIVIIASNARLATAGSGSVIALRQDDRA